MKNETRNFVKIIKEICDEEKIDYQTFSNDWIFKLWRGNIYNYIIGYQFGLNSCAVHSICCDKSATSEILTSLGIPNIQHYFFMSPINQKYIGDYGNWENIINILKKYGKLVCKSNEGTGGNQVFCVSNQNELENAVFKIFKKSRAMAICPYYDIQNEYRIIVLNGEIKLIYSKQRPYIVGDGIHTISGLLLKNMIDNGSNLLFRQIDRDDFNKVLNNGEVFFLNWKHNLGQGAYAHIENLNLVDDEINKIVEVLVGKMNIKFASIDMVKCNDEYKVLEINSGVMMEHFSQQNENTYIIAKDIYKEAILNMLK